MRFLLGQGRWTDNPGHPGAHTDHEYKGDLLELTDSLRELLGCQVGFRREAPGGAQWVEDPDHPAGGYEQYKPITLTIEVIGSRHNAETVRGLIVAELAKQGQGHVGVQIDN